MVFLYYKSEKFDYDKVMNTLNKLIIKDYDETNDDINIYDFGFGIDGENSYQNIYHNYNFANQKNFLIDLLKLKNMNNLSLISKRFSEPFYNFYIFIFK